MSSLCCPDLRLGHSCCRLVTGMPLRVSQPWDRNIPSLRREGSQTAIPREHRGRRQQQQSRANTSQPLSVQNFRMSPLLSIRRPGGRACGGGRGVGVGMVTFPSPQVAGGWVGPGMWGMFWAGVISGVFGFVGVWSACSVLRRSGVLLSVEMENAPTRRRSKAIRPTSSSEDG